MAQDKKINKVYKAEHDLTCHVCRDIIKQGKRFFFLRVTGSIKDKVVHPKCKKRIRVENLKAAKAYYQAIHDKRQKLAHND